MKLLLIILLDFTIGVATLMCGVHLMSSGLEKAHLSSIRRAMSILTGRLLYAVITGIVITALVQSSTAVTVMTVSFVNSGIMQFKQAVGIIYGANIGTTVTAQLMSFNITKPSLPIAALGLTFFILAKKPQTRNLAKAVSGLGLMFFGIGMMNSGAPLIKESRRFQFLILYIISRESL